MKLQTVFKIGRNIAIALAVLIVAVWLAFVPQAKEPPYEFVSAWGEKGGAPGQFNDPTGIAVAGDELFVSDSRNGRIQVFDKDGRYKRQFGAPGNGPGQLGRPMNVTVHEGNLYVGEYFNDRIQVFGPDGAFLRKWGGPFAMNIFGPFNGWFATVTNVTVDRTGHVFAADFYSHRIQKFAADGTFVISFGAKGSGQGQFNHAIAVAVANDGTAFAVDFGNNRIEKWRPGK